MAVLTQIPTTPFYQDTFGIIRSIIVDLPTGSYMPEGVTRKAKTIRTIDGPDKEMDILLHIDYYVGNERLLDIIQADTTLSQTAKELKMSQFATYGFVKSTRNSWVMIDGSPVEPNEAGEYPEGAIPELLWFQNLTWQNMTALGLPVTADTPELVKQYWMEAAMISIIAQRNGL